MQSWLPANTITQLNFPTTMCCCRRYVHNTLLAAAEETCALTTLSGVIRKEQLRHIDLLKIDVEGAELDVLRGVDAEHWPRIRQVLSPSPPHTALPPPEPHCSRVPCYCLQAVVEVESYGTDATPELSSVKTLLQEAGFDCIVVDEPLRGSRVFQVYAWRCTGVPASAQNGCEPL